jgi:hypothetical protein
MGNKSLRALISILMVWSMVGFVPGLTAQSAALPNNESRFFQSDEPLGYQENVLLSEAVSFDRGVLEATDVRDDSVVVDYETSSNDTSDDPEAPNDVEGAFLLTQTPKAQPTSALSYDDGAGEVTFDFNPNIIISSDENNVVIIDDGSGDGSLEEPGTDSNPVTDPEPGTDSNPVTDPEPGDSLDSSTDPQPGSDPDEETSPDPVTETQPDTDPDSAADSNQGGGGQSTV